MAPEPLLLAVLLMALALVMLPAFVVPAWRAWRRARRHRDWQAWSRTAPRSLDDVAAELASDRRAALELWSTYLPGLRTPALPSPRSSKEHGGAEVIVLRQHRPHQQTEVAAEE